ncbi:MAG: DNA polymerase III subunit gamma/tau [Bacteroidetes bacterium]|nr:DNA polymerase III subunit gamma/tau [Bacteroidota bacterium]
MSFLVTARKYRPSTFQEVVAQGHVVNTLLNSIRLGRIAHAYLFSGPRGVGKTTTARIFAKALNCPNAKEGEPCNTCDTCVEISQGRCIDIIEIDGASNNGVEQVRTIRDSVRYMPSREKYKMYIIDEVHMLSKGAFNALLKTLEEPPAHAIFIFATTEPHRLPPTVISRCQRYDFRRIALEDIVGQLKHICLLEGIEAEDTALFAIARKGDGSMRDSESIFDQVVAFSGNQLTYESVRHVLHVVDQETFFQLTDLIITNNSSGGFALAEEIVMSGYDIQDFLTGIEEHYRNLLVARATGDTRLIEAPEDVRERYSRVAEQFSEGDLLRLLKITAQTMQAVKFSPQPRLKFEVALIDMIKMDSTIEISTLLSNMGQGGSIPPSRSPGEKHPGSTSAGRSSQHSAPTAAAAATSAVAVTPKAASTGEQMETTSPEAVPSPVRSSGPFSDADAPGNVTRKTNGRTVDAGETWETRFGPPTGMRSAVTDVTEPLREAEERFRQALTSASLSAAGSHRAQPASSQPLPTHPIVQLLIDKLDAVVLPKH